MDNPGVLSTVMDTVRSFISPFTVIAIALGAVAFAWLTGVYRRWQKNNRRRCIDNQCREVPPNETIFVSMPSYRDPQCAETLFDLFEKAHCPFRIFVGVFQQNYSQQDADVLESYRKLAEDGVGDFSDHIRVLRVEADEAKGPVYARHMIESKLFRNERFYFVTDSHMLFTPNWDQKLIQEWNQCRKISQRPVLTMYPENFQPHHRSFPPSGYENANGSYLRFKKFNETNRMVEIEGPCYLRKPSSPTPSLFWAACFSFASSEMIRDVPFDPRLEYVFFGEEISMAARLWTSGYDLFNPTTMYAYHMWERKRPTFWQQFDNKSDPIHRERQERERLGYQHLYRVLNMDPAQDSTVLPPFGLGRERSLEAFEQRIGINMRTQQFTSLSGILGVQDNAPAHEILSKFGTWKQFSELKGRLTKHLA